jgi:integrase
MARRRGPGEGLIRRRPDGRWEARLDLGWQNGKRKRKSFYGATRAEVRDKLTKAMRDLQQGLPLPGERLTVAAFLTRWLEDVVRHSVSPSTHEGYSRLVRLHVNPRLGKVLLARLTAAQVTQLYSALLDRGLAPRYVRLLHAVLRRALKQAVRWNLLPRNPLESVDPPRSRTREFRVLSAEEAARFLEAAKEDRLFALYVLALTTGMRLGELLALRWSDVSLETGEVRVTRKVSRIKGKGLTFSEPKTAKSRRSIVLAPMAVEALRQHRTAQLQERLAAGPAWEEQDLVFPNLVGRPYERQNVSQRGFKRLLQKAGLPSIRFHDLRHSAATLLLAHGIHPKVVQEMLGHSSIALTMDTYSHVMPTLQREAAETVEKALLGSRGGQHGGQTAPQCLHRSTHKK